MGLGDQIKNAAEGALDKAKDVVDKLNDDDGLDLDGKLAGIAEKAKEAGARIKDEAGELAEDVKETAGDTAASVKAKWDQATDKTD